MKRLALAILAGAGFLHAQEDYTQWSQNANITINTSASGYRVSGNVLKFPYLVRLDSTFNFSQSIGRGADVRFSKLNGTRLRYQLERWDSAGKKAEFWVLLDTVYGNNATQAFRMHWGRAGAADSSRGAAVFDTANGFAGVWHLGGSTYLGDATANANTAQIATGTNHNTAGPLDTNGVIGRGRQFTDARTGAVIRKLTVPGSASLDITGSAITVSAWMNSGDWGPANDGQTTGNRRIICKGNSDNTTGYILTETTDQDYIQLSLGGVPEPPLVDEFYLPVNSWRLIHATYNGTRLALYVDGVLLYTGFAFGDNIAGTGSTTLNGNGLHIGGRGNTTVRDQFIGQLDEVRVHKVGRDSNWARLEYMNQKLPGFSPVPTSARPGRSISAAPAFSVKASGRGLVFGLAALEQQAAPQQVSIVDLRGRTMWAAASQGGAALIWDGLTSEGLQAARGVYVVRVTPLGQSGRAVQRTVTYAP